MNYELAKSLKDAGFPQKIEMNESEGWYIDEEGKFTGRLYAGAIYAPTLQELIQACKQSGGLFRLWTALG
jgi:hypothetical protein